MSRKPCSSNSEHSHSADSTSASGVGLAVLLQQPLVERAGVDADPDRDAGVRRGLRDLLDLVVELLDVAGVHADRGAAGVDRREDVLRLEVDVGDHRDLRLLARSSAARRRRPGSGTATRTIWQPDAVSSAICCSVASMSDVGVVVIDCTETGASPPTSTPPTLICRDLRRSASLGRDGRHAECDGHRGGVTFCRAGGTPPVSPALPGLSGSVALHVHDLAQRVPDLHQVAPRRP